MENFDTIYVVDQVLLRKNLYNALIKRPVSFAQLAKELRLSVMTIRKLMLGKDIVPLKATILSKYVDRILGQNVAQK